MRGRLKYYIGPSQLAMFFFSVITRRPARMDPWKGKVAVVTGASSGIGAALCLELARAEIIVIGLARRVAKIEVLRLLRFILNKLIILYTRNSKCIGAKATFKHRRTGTFIRPLL